MERGAHKRNEKETQTLERVAVSIFWTVSVKTLPSALGDDTLWVCNPYACGPSSTTHAAFLSNPAELRFASELAVRLGIARVGVGLLAT